MNHFILILCQSLSFFHLFFPSHFPITWDLPECLPIYRKASPSHVRLMWVVFLLSFSLHWVTWDDKRLINSHFPLGYTSSISLSLSISLCLSHCDPEWQVTKSLRQRLFQSPSITVSFLSDLFFLPPQSHNPSSALSSRNCLLFFSSSINFLSSYD